MNKGYCWFILFILFGIPAPGEASNAHFSGYGKDSCAINDFCSSAIELQVNTDLGFTCTTGCTNLATAEIVDNPCGIGQFPTVWYRVNTELGAATMNIHVQSDDIRSPGISLFIGMPDCEQLQSVDMTSSKLSCVQGYNGIAKAIGTKVKENQIYYIAITDPDNVGGSFELCVNTLSTGSNCVISRNIEITGRSSGGPLEGPFEPGETISVCFNVDSFSTSSLPCQWLQGIVPVFGNGWNWKSFDPNGQPMNATINGNPIGAPENGNYGAATWDWFEDVDYHFDNPYLQVGDLDHNGTVEMCNSLYDPDCPDLGGIQGGCCSPCWQGTLGTILPPGWFAYGINGVCPAQGPPIRVDWGDGNSCSDVMGPWHFCFDLVTRLFPDCDQDNSTSDLSLGFFTFTDVETGSWNGGPDLCYDQPAYWRPGFQCRTEYDLGTVTLPDQCSDNLVTYELFEPGVNNWEWTVTPSSFVQDSVFEGGNGHILECHPHYTGSFSSMITYSLIGHLSTSNTIVIKKIKFRVWPRIQFQLPEYIDICEYKPGSVTITPSFVKGGKPPYHYVWNPGGDTLSSLLLSAPFHSGIINLLVYDTIGCAAKDSLQVRLKSCHFDDMFPKEEPNDTINPQNPSWQDIGIPAPDVKWNIRSNEHVKNDGDDIQIYPSPTVGLAILKWTIDLKTEATIRVYDSKGVLIKIISVSPGEEHQKAIDVQSFQPGVYFVCFGNGDFRYVARLIKM